MLPSIQKFIKDFPDYDIDVKLCAFASVEMIEAQKVFFKESGVES